MKTKSRIIVCIGLSALFILNLSSWGQDHATKPKARFVENERRLKDSVAEKKSAAAVLRFGLEMIALEIEYPELIQALEKETDNLKKAERFNNAGTVSAVGAGFLIGFGLTASDFGQRRVGSELIAGGLGLLGTGAISSLGEIGLRNRNELDKASRKLIESTDSEINEAADFFAEVFGWSHLTRQEFVDAVKQAIIEESIKSLKNNRSNPDIDLLKLIIEKDMLPQKHVEPIKRIQEILATHETPKLTPEPVNRLTQNIEFLRAMEEDLGKVLEQSPTNNPNWFKYDALRGSIKQKLMEIEDLR